MPPSPGRRCGILSLACAALTVSACAPTPVVFRPATCRADPCATPVRLVADSTNPVPDYPEIMAAVGIEGTVVAEFVVLPSGSVDTASVMIRSMTNRAFERFSVEAIAKWRFHSTNGTALAAPTGYRVTLRYVLGDIRCPGPRIGTATSAWAMRGGKPVLTVESCAPRLVPRDQIRPMRPTPA